MRRIFLIRHGTPEKAPGEKRYIGQTDLPLSLRGKWEMEACAKALLEECGQRRVLIAASPLMRCQESAKILAKTLGVPEGEILFDPALSEICLGSWENERICDIRKAQPEAYSVRGEHPGFYRTPGGETFEEVGQRVLKSLQSLLRIAEPDQDLVICTHAGCIRALLCILQGISPDLVFSFHVPCASLTVLSGEMGNWFLPALVGVRPYLLLDEEEIHRLYRAYETPDPVIEHMEAVEKACQRILNGAAERPLFTAGVRARIGKAALVHDLVRTRHNHEALGAKILVIEGYPDIAALVGAHNSEDENPDGPLTPEEVLCYADWTTRGTRRVSIEERFRLSENLCCSLEARRHHDARYQKAQAIERKLCALTHNTAHCRERGFYERIL